jgi:preprotein translocase subunit SecD
VAPPRRSGPHPGRVLAALGVLILVMLIGITGKETFSPAKWQQQFKVGLGLDLSSGTQVVLKAYTLKGTPPTAGDMNQAINILESRVNGTGTTGASVVQQGTDQINVSVPGKNEQQVINLVSNTARLAFRPVLLWAPYTKPGAAKPGATPSATPSGTASPTATPSASPSAKAGASPSASSTKAKTSALIVRAGSTPSPSASAKASATPSPSATASGSASSSTFGNPGAVNAETMKLFDKLVCTPSKTANQVDESWKATVGYTNQKSQWDDPNSQIVSCDSNGNKFVLDKTTFDGSAVTSVTPGLQQNSTGWIVNITLNDKATKAFGELTTNQANKYLPGASTNEDDAVLDQTAVVLGGDVVEAPQTQGALTSGSFEINGGSQGFTQEQATYLANVVKYGQLPLNFQRLSANYISPTLGHNSLVAGLIAGVIGLAIVIIYLFCYYRGLGFVAVSSLMIAGLLSYLGVVLLSKYENFTMELAGIAGLIVAIGITADSFIVYFERLRDEVRDGKQLRPAVESGWRRARRTILVSDTVSFMAAVLLYKFATSDVQGFAFTLGLTTLIDVLVVFTFTKPMMTILAGTKFFGGGHRWSGLDPMRLGARAPWRSSVRRQQRTPRATTAARANQTTGTSSTTPREA